MPTPAETVRAVFAAYEQKDRAALERLIPEDFAFTSPLDNQLDRETYFARCWPNSENIERFEFVRLLSEGDQVVVTYVAHNKGGHVGRNTECFTVRDGQVTSVEVYFGWSVPHEAKPGGWVEQ